MRIATNSTNDSNLMNELQNRGLVSDNCETINDVADCDLIEADKKLIPKT
jgi:hypothetical protein